MAKTVTEILRQAISDFNNIETAIEECGVDVPYDTDTSEYGNKVREVYAKALSEGGGEPLVINANTHYEFPSVGNVNAIYKAYSEKLIYQWNEKDLKYEVLGAIENSFQEITLINGGNSSGT